MFTIKTVQTFFQGKNWYLKYINFKDGCFSF